MKHRFLTTTLFLFFIAFANAQTIKGQVIDEKGSSIIYATVALHNAKDSSIIKGESTDENGFFKLKADKEDKYFVKATMLGYSDRSSDVFEIAANDLDLGKIILANNSELIEGVEIVDKLPLMEQMADKLIVNVEGNVTNTSGSLLDVMKKVPGMLVINDRLSMVGSGSPTILLNGKSTQYMDVQSLLRDMPGDNIKKVEIIHQPGAEYEAAGSGPIINIILKKNSLFGTNGSITAGVGKGKLWDYTTGLNLSHYEGNFNISGGLGYTRNAWWEQLYITRRVGGIGNQIDGVYDQVSEDAARPITYRGNLRADWDMTDKHRLGFETKYYNNTNNYVATNFTDVDITDVMFDDYQLNTNNFKERGWTYNSINPYYIFEIDTSGQKLELDVSRARYQVESMSTLVTTNNLDPLESQQRYIQPGDTKIFAASVDYTKPISQGLEFKVGAKYSMADLDNNLRSEFLFDDQWVNNVDQSNHYLFNEEIYAGYGKVSWKKGVWSGTAGLRYEKSESVGESLTLDSILTRPIEKLFPSFSLSRDITDGLKASVAYSYRIDRPRYSTLNPFVFYLDPFTYEQGNQSLRPELTHSAKFTLSLEGQPFFNVEYKRSTDAIVEVTEQDQNSQEARKTDINFDEQNQLSITMLFPLDFIPGLSGYGGTVVTRNEFNSFYSDAQFDRSKWNTTAFLQAEFKLPWEINAEIGGWYTSSNQEGIFNSEWLFGTSFGMSKKFLDKKLKVSLGVEDFARRFWHANVDYQQDMDLISNWQTPVVNARVSYKFGNQHLKSKKKGKTSASEEIRRATQN